MAPASYTAPTPGPSNHPSPSKLPAPSPQKQVIHQAWTPEVRIDYETGEMNSIPGSAKVYSNGYPDGQLYVYNDTARNMPTNRPVFTFEEAVPAIMETESFSVVVPQPPPLQLPNFTEMMDMCPAGTHHQPQNHQPWTYRSQTYNPSNYRIAGESYAWLRVYEVYGTAIGIILKSMYLQTPPKIPGDELSWLLQLGLPLERTQFILEMHYYRNPNFYDVGNRLYRHRPRELKDRLRTGVEASSWPGNTDFSELRATFEILRRKALELLERYRDVFDQEYRLKRRKQY